VLSVLRLDQDYSSYEKFETERRQYHKAADSVVRSIWLLLTPGQRSVFGALVTLSHALTRKRGRDDEADSGLAVVKYRAGPGRERRAALETVQFMMDEMLPEIRREIAKEMALRPMMRFLRASKASMALVSGVFPLFLQRDILANLDYSDEGMARVRQMGAAFRAKFAPDGRRFWYDRELSADEREWLVSELAQIGIGGQTAETIRIEKNIFSDLLVFGVPTDATPFQLYREVMEELARSLWSVYRDAQFSASRDVGRRGCVWVAFSTPTHGHLFDVRFTPSQVTDYNDSVNYGVRELRVLTGDPAMERLFAPLREFYLARDRVFPKLVPVEYDDSDEDEMQLESDEGDVAAEKTAFQDSMLNLLYGLSPLLTMTVEVQKEAAPVETWYAALDTNGRKRAPEAYAKRSTAVAAANKTPRALTGSLQGFFRS
jgi:hypothetical protein